MKKLITTIFTFGLIFNIYSQVFNGSVTIDNDNNSTGAITNDAYMFGSGSGEGITCGRASGSQNQFGLNLWTNFLKRMEIKNSGIVNIGSLNTSNGSSTAPSGGHSTLEVQSLTNTIGLRVKTDATNTSKWLGITNTYGRPGIAFCDASTNIFNIRGYSDGLELIKDGKDIGLGFRLLWHPQYDYSIMNLGNTTYNSGFAGSYRMFIDGGILTQNLRSSNHDINSNSSTSGLRFLSLPFSTNPTNTPFDNKIVNSNVYQVFNHKFLSLDNSGNVILSPTQFESVLTFKVGIPYTNYVSKDFHQMGIGTYDLFSTPKMQVNSDGFPTALLALSNSNIAGKIGVHGIAKSTSETKDGWGGQFEGDIRGASAVVMTDIHDKDLFGMRAYCRNQNNTRSSINSIFGLYAEANLTDPDGWAYGVYGRVNYPSTLPSIITHFAGYFDGPLYATQTLWSSDQKLKKDIKVLNEALSIVKELTPRTYTYRSEEFKGMNLPTDKQYGFIAQELEKIIPEAVKSIQSPAIYDDKDTQEFSATGFKSVNYITLIPILTQAIKEQQTQIEDVKSENQMLKERLATIEKMIGVKNEGLNQIKDELFDPNPNPTNGATEISYQLSQEYSNAYITIMGLDGKVIESYKLSAQKGKSSIKTDLSKLASGIYLYSLVAGERVIDSKRLQVNK